MAIKVHDRLDGKVALVTGASRGIGRAVAAAYAGVGAKVFICARTQSDVSRTVAEIREQGGAIDGCAGDLGSLQDVKRVVRSLLDRYERMDILVNNASLLGPRVPITEYPISAWEEVLRVNLTGIFYMTQEVLGSMIPRRRGSIINVSSGVGRVGKARWGAYAASKFGVEGLTQVLAEELKENGIRFNAVNPGSTRTEMRAAAYPDEDPLILPKPEQITEVFVYLASDESMGVTGQSFNAQDWHGPGSHRQRP